MTATEMAGVVREHLGIMDELIRSFGPEDSTKVMAIQQAYEDVVATVANKEQSVRDLIRSMTRDVSRLESEMMPPETAESHEDAMGRLTQQVRESHQRIAQGHAMVEGQQRHRQHIRDRLAQAEGERDRVAAFKAELEDRQRQLALMKHISSIDVDPSGWPSRVRGFVVDMSKAGPRHFDFDATVSRTEMADRLWALMDE